MTNRQITQWLSAWQNGDQAAFVRLVETVYDELRRIAARRLRMERRGHTLQPTALVHEAYGKLLPLQNLAWRDRAHFFAVAARLMRQALIDYAKAKNAQRRGGGLKRVSLAGLGGVEAGVDVLRLDEAMTRLAQIAPRQARALELAFFGGLTKREIAAALGFSEATVYHELKAARGWLLRQLGG